jgi:hypothetical protein
MLVWGVVGGVVVFPWPNLSLPNLDLSGFRVVLSVPFRGNADSRAKKKTLWRTIKMRAWGPSASATDMN